MAAVHHVAQIHSLCATIPLQARVNIPDERLDWLVNLHKPKSVIPAFLEVRRCTGQAHFCEPSLAASSC